MEVCNPLNSLFQKLLNKEMYVIVIKNHYHSSIIVLLLILFVFNIIKYFLRISRFKKIIFSNGYAFSSCNFFKNAPFVKLTL